MSLLFAVSTLAGPAGGTKPAPTNNSAATSLADSIKKQRESLEKQRQSLHQQSNVKEELAAPSVEFISPIPPLVEADCDPLPSDQVESLIASAAQKQSLDPALIRAVMHQESAFRPCAISIKGAQGLMQLMPTTAAELHVTDPFDPKQNVDAGAALLKQLLEKYKGDLRLALVAYNAGANRADDPNVQTYPAETQHYIANIFAELGLPPIQSPSDDSETENPAPVTPPITKNQ